MIFGDPGGQIADDVQSMGIIKPTAQGPAGGLQRVEIEDASQFLGDVPVQHKHVYYADPTGRMQVGLWDSTAFERAVAPFPRNELMCILEGSVVLTDGDGREHHCKAGDTVYIPQGVECGWKSTERVRKFYSVYVA
jgi:uncharacterized cupin superfamily protein